MNTKILYETERVYVEKPSTADFENLSRILTDADMMRFFGGPRTEEQIIFSMDRAIAHYEKHGFSYGCAYLKDTNKLIGRTGIIRLEFNDTAEDIEFGGFLLKEYWHQGYALEIGQFFIDYIHNELQVDKAVAVIHPENIASLRGAERLKMQYEKDIPYMGFNCRYYSKIAHRD